jgi:hypothetical protein
MKHMGRPYYVGLLPAAQLHGAAHHRPQEFQVVIPKRTVRPVRAGNVLVRKVSSSSVPFHSMKPVVPSPTRFSVARLIRRITGADLSTISRVIGHRAFSGVLPVTVQYVSHGYASETRTAVERWARHIEGLLGIEREDDKVVPMRRAAEARA